MILGPALAKYAKPVSVPANVNELLNWVNNVFALGYANLIENIHRILNHIYDKYNENVRLKLYDDFMLNLYILRKWLIRYGVSVSYR